MLKNRMFKARLSSFTGYLHYFSVFILYGVFTNCVAGSDGVESGIGSLLRAYENYDNGPIFVVAHRGCWSAAPENSVESINACVRLGVEVVEIDVRLTKDQRLVVFHDKTLERMSNGQGAVADKTLAELKALYLYERDGSSTSLVDKKILTRHRIPTLREIFSAARGKMLINLEIKPKRLPRFQEVYGRSVELAREMGIENHILWKIPAVKGGLNARADGRVQKLEPRAKPYLMPIVWQSEHSFEAQMADFKGLGVRGFEVVAQDSAYWPTMADGRIWGADKYRYMGIAVLPRWSAGFSDEVALFDPDAAWGKLLDLGMDLIMTDRPEQLIEYLKGKGLR